MNEKTKRICPRTIVTFPHPNPLNPSQINFAMASGPCIGPQCMAWRANGLEAGVLRISGEEDGYCGLAGQP